MSYSEVGPSNGQISKRLIDTGRNHSGSIPIWSGDLQLQGLTLCGSVTAGRHNSIFLKLHNIFDQHRSPVDRHPLMIWTLCFLCLPCLPLPSNAVNMKAWTCTAQPQYSVKFGDNSVEIWYFTGQDVLFWSGSVNRPDLQTAYRYGAKSFMVDSNMIGRSAVTRSDLMRVGHSWMPKLNIFEILTNFWPASEPCRQATIKYMDFIFPVFTLPSLTCPPCKYEGMDMHSSSTVVCKI